MTETNCYWNNLCPIGKKLYAIEERSGQLACMDTSNGNPHTWETFGSNKANNAYSGTWDSLCAIGDKLYAIEKNSGQLVCMDTNATNPTWMKFGSNTADNAYNGIWSNFCAIGSKLYAIEYISGQLVCMDTAVPGSITIAGATKTISGQTDIYIEPSQMLDNNIAFDMTNIKLISAEITNQPYETVTLTKNIADGTEVSGNNLALELSRAIQEPSKYQFKIVVESPPCEWKAITAGTTPASFGNNWRYLAYGNGKFMAMSDSNQTAIYNSAASTPSWTRVTPPAPSGQLAFSSNNKFMTIEGDGKTAICNVATGSTPSWTTSGTTKIIANETNDWQNLAFGGVRFMAMSTNGKTAYCLLIATTPSWTQITAGTTPNSIEGSGGWRNLAYSNDSSKFLAMNDNGKTAFCVGVSWTEITAGKTPNSIEKSGWQNLVYGSTKLLAMNTNGKTAIYDDTSWTHITVGQTPNSIVKSGWINLAYGGRFMAMNANGKTAIYDGTSWAGIMAGTTPNSIEESGWNHLVYGSNIFLAMNTNGKTAISDGTSWMQITDGATLNSIVSGWNCLAYGDDQFMAMNNNGATAICEVKPSTITIGLTFTTILPGLPPVLDGGTAHKVLGTQTFYVDPSSSDLITYIRLTNVKLISAKLVDQSGNELDAIYQFPQQRLPEKSRTVDFSQKNDTGAPVCSDGVALGPSSIISSPASKHFIMSSSTPPSICTFIPLEMPGDFYCLLEDTGEKPSLLYPRNFDNAIGTTDTARTLTGFHRLFLTLGEYPAAGAVLDLVNGGRYNLFMGGFTSPVNAVFEDGVGANGSSVGTTGWYNTSDGDPQAACRNVTIAACSWLKDAYNGSDGDNLRIYIVKYRKQDQYKHKITNEDTNFDYSYLDTCATDASHIHTANNPTELEVELQEIARDIKEWAGRTPARLCAEL
jgi:hypothetical protein